MLGFYILRAPFVWDFPVQMFVPSLKPRGDAGLKKCEVLLTMMRQ